MISVFNLLMYSIIDPHHTFIKLLAKRENHHLQCRAWSVHTVFYFHQYLILD